METGRRVFLGSAAAVGIGSLGTVVTGGTMALAQRNSGTDPVHREIVEQLLRSVRKLQNIPTGEASRSIGASLHLLTVWGRTNRIDDTIRKALRDAVRKKGRATLLAQPFDLEAELKMRGWKVPPGIGILPTPAELSDALDDMLQHGITGHWADYAKAFEGAAIEIDRRSARPALVARQVAPGQCSGMQFMLLMLATQTYIACSVGMMAGPEFCIIAGGLALGWQWYMWSQGC